MRVGETPSTTAPKCMPDDRSVKRTFKIGNPSLIGKFSIQILWQNEDEEHSQVYRFQRPEKATSVFKTTGLGLNVQLPSWLASRMVAILVEKSYGAWQASLAVFRTHGLREPRARKAMAMILSDDEQAMRQALERREVGPRDWFFDTDGNECTLSEVSSCCFQGLGT